MNHSQLPDGADPLNDDDLAAIYGDAANDIGNAQAARKKDFLPWHHPVKQFIRKHQWLVQADRLIADTGLTTQELRYLTLPGVDMMDVRFLGEHLQKKGLVLECLGFNTSLDGHDNANSQSGKFNAESILRQQGLITDNSITLPDRLEDIAVGASHASNQLKSWRAFDIVNIDICGHIAGGRANPSVMDAVARIVEHQRVSDRPWLFMMTTRVHPEQMGDSKGRFDQAIQRNIQLGTDFTEILAAALSIDVVDIESGLQRAWDIHDNRFVKLFAVGLGKYLLHLLHNQYQDPARVELKSCMAYRVHGEVADMLSMAFLIKPAAKRLIPANADALQIPPVEVVHANQIARKAGLLFDVDEALIDAESMSVCILESEQLLTSCDYDISKYREWLRDHEYRPIAHPLILAD